VATVIVNCICILAGENIVLHVKEEFMTWVVSDLCKRIATKALYFVMGWTRRFHSQPPLLFCLRLNWYSTCKSLDGNHLKHAYRMNMASEPGSNLWRKMGDKEFFQHVFYTNLRKDINCSCLFTLNIFVFYDVLE
jgi:hypothetical protein